MSKTEETILVCIGPMVGAKNKLVGRWARVTVDQLRKAEEGAVLDLTDVLYYGKFQKHATPGQMFSVQMDGTTIRDMDDVRYMGLWPDAKARVRWTAEANVARGRYAAMKKMKEDRKMDSDPLYECTLQEIREEYRDTPTMHRAQMLSRIVYLLTRP